MTFEEIYDNSTIRVIKNDKTKRAFEVLDLIERVGTRKYLAFKIWLFKENGFVNRKGDFLREIEYVETKPKKTMEEMQKEFLNKNKATKCEDDTRVYNEGLAHTYKTKSHYNKNRDSKKSKEMTLKYEGISVYNKIKDKKISFSKNKVVHGLSSRNSLAMEIYYNMEVTHFGKYLNDGSVKITSHVCKEPRIEKYINDKDWEITN